MKIGFLELLVIFAVALLVIGPDKLPEAAKQLGQALGAFRKASQEMTSAIKEDIVAPLEEAMEPVEDLKKEVNSNLKDLETSINDLGKEPKASTITEETEKNV